MNVRERRERLSALINLPTSQCDKIASVTMTPTTDSSRTDRQFQGNTLRKDSEDQPEVQIDISGRLEKQPIVDLMNDEKILTALIEKDGKTLDHHRVQLSLSCLGQRWSQFIEQLTDESSLRAPHEVAQQLLDRVHQKNIR